MKEFLMIIESAIPFIHDYLQKKRFRPDIYISGVKIRGSFCIEFTNLGNEDIKDLDVIISYQQNGKPYSHALKLFIDENQTPGIASARNCKILGEKERKIAVDIPSYSDGGKINVAVQGIGSKSKKHFSKNFTINNKQ